MRGVRQGLQAPVTPPAAPAGPHQREALRVCTVSEGCWSLAVPGAHTDAGALGCNKGGAIASIFLFGSLHHLRRSHTGEDPSECEEWVRFCSVVGIVGGFRSVVGRTRAEEDMSHLLGVLWQQQDLTSMLECLVYRFCLVVTVRSPCDSGPHLCWKACCSWARLGFGPGTPRRPHSPISLCNTEAFSASSGKTLEGGTEWRMPSGTTRSDLSAKPSAVAVVSFGWETNAVCAAKGSALYLGGACSPSRGDGAAALS